MSVIKRVGAVEAAALALRDMVAAGKWTDRLPGTRVLAGLLGVSQPTVQLALIELAKDGVLESAGERKAYRVKERGAKAAADATPKTRRVILLTHQAIERTAESGRQTFETLQRLLSTAGWQVEFRVVDFLHARTPHRSWDNLIGAEPGEPVVALFGRPCLAEWALKRGVRMVFLGGVTDGYEVPVVAVKSAHLLSEAYRKLIALGHKRIVTPLCDRPQSYLDTMKETAKAELEAAGFAYSPAYHTPESDYLRPDVTWSILETLFKRERPTALVLLDWRELVTVTCFLMRIGLRVPEDVSVVLLNDQVNAEWFQPDLARFKFPIARMARRLKAWVEEKWEPEDMRMGVAAEWVPGESIAAPPKG
ncbi:substrate-binding domain-containing protein [Luteolibacter sp. LG18]|uniref:substrate-binding domain-containing protein n=1 Tax=Luteolibacter sp. LG18 TaxID=2819286 RepID=UPI002B2BB0FE|nr:hypothetical protein llg_10490 [Luteolibacter sp. LG18]